MKSLFSLLMAVLITTVAMAQTTNKIVVKTTGYKLFDYGRMSTVTTTDATPVNIDAITIASNEAGLIEVQVVGIDDSLNTAVTGSRIARYSKVGGTLTMATPDTISTPTTGSALSGATWALSASGNNIVVTVTGKAGFDIKWKAVVRRLSVTP